MQIPQYLYGTNEDLQRYFELLIRTLSNGLGDNGFTIPPLTAAQVATVTNFNFRPILPFGIQWFNSTLKKMQFITNQADPATNTNATIETIASV